MRRLVQMARISGLPNGERGLSAPEVAARRVRYGANEIVEAPRAGWRNVLRDTAKDPMIWFLAATAILFAVVGDRVGSFVMVGAMLPLVGMDAFLHRRTQASTHGLRSRLATEATVIRDGVRTAIPAVEVVPGDLVVIEAGRPFPADGLVVAGESLQVDESALTGEAFPVPKRVATLDRRAAGDQVVDGTDWGFAGTRLLTGEARMRIVATGAETLYGEIVRSAAEGEHARTPLQQSIATLVAGLLVVAGALCLVLAWIRLRQGHGIVDALISAVTLAVAAIPEEFPIVFTFFLGVGIFRLARRQALVRRAVAVENVGRVTCICCDKTGTLTEGRIRLAHRIPAASVESSELLEIAAMASREQIADPLDAAIFDAGATETPGSERLATFPFTEDRRRETGVFRAPSGSVIAATKGAPETILALCRLDDAERASWAARVEALARDAHKVVACAAREFRAGEWYGTEPIEGYRLAGLLACEDPVRAGVAEAVADAQRAGIQVIMITGDHASTAEAVAREIGIGGSAPRTIEGDRLEEIVARGALAQVDVIARALPAQKLSLVRALQARGEIVAVTGDGVNDVPALQAADVGIAMGERGTQSAREIAAIVLLDDNFRTIVSAIAEGRQLSRNLRSSFAYLLMIHIPLVFTATLIPLAGYPLLYLPIHIVWLELVIHPTALLVFQELPAESQLRPVADRERDGRFFTVHEWLVIGLVGAAVTLAVGYGYDRSLGSGLDVEHARAMALVALVVASAALTAALSGLRTRVSRTVVALTVLSALVLVQFPPSAALLGLAPLHADEWLIAAAAGVVPSALAALFRWART
jgi:P-type Ca2+ transporter type 2C